MLSPVNYHGGYLNTLHVQWSAMGSGPWPCPGEAQASDGLNELPELHKYDWSLGLSGGMSQVLRPLPEKFLLHGVDVHPSLSSLPLLMSYRTQDYLWGLVWRGIPPPGNVVPGWSHRGPRSQGWNPDTQLV